MSKSILIYSQLFKYIFKYIDIFLNFNDLYKTKDLNQLLASFSPYPESGIVNWS